MDAVQRSDCKTCGRPAEQVERINEKGLCKMCSLVERVEESVSLLTDEVNKFDPRD